MSHESYVLEPLLGHCRNCRCNFYFTKQVEAAPMTKHLLKWFVLEVPFDVGQVEKCTWLQKGAEQGHIQSSPWKEMKAKSLRCLMMIMMMMMVMMMLMLCWWWSLLFFEEGNFISNKFNFLEGVWTYLPLCELDVFGRWSAMQRSQIHHNCGPNG